MDRRYRFYTRKIVWKLSMKHYCKLFLTNVITLNSNSIDTLLFISMKVLISLWKTLQALKHITYIADLQYHCSFCNEQTSQHRENKKYNSQNNMMENMKRLPSAWHETTQYAWPASETATTPEANKSGNKKMSLLYCTNMPKTLQASFIKRYQFFSRF